MPIYEYRCKECHQIFEEWSAQSGDAAPRPCPICAEPSEPLVTGPAQAVWPPAPQGVEEQSCNFAAPACGGIAFAGVPTGPWRK